MAYSEYNYLLHNDRRISSVYNDATYKRIKGADSTQTLSEANQVILDADNRLKDGLSAIEKGDKTFTELAFATAASYTTSYGLAVKDYIAGVSNKQKLLKYASDLLAGMQEIKTHTGDLSYFTMEMVIFLDKQGISFDRAGDDFRHNKDEWTVNIEYLNHWIKALSNEVETDVIKLNDIINKQNQILQSTTTILKKIQSMLESMLKNFA